MCFRRDFNGNAVIASAAQRRVGWASARESEDRQRGAHARAETGSIAYPPGGRRGPSRRGAQSQSPRARTRWWRARCVAVLTAGTRRGRAWPRAGPGPPAAAPARTPTPGRRRAPRPPWPGRGRGPRPAGLSGSSSCPGGASGARARPGWAEAWPEARREAGPEAWCQAWPEAPGSVSSAPPRPAKASTVKRSQAESVGERRPQAAGRALGRTE